MQHSFDYTLAVCIRILAQIVRLFHVIFFFFFNIVTFASLHICFCSTGTMTSWNDEFNLFVAVADRSLNMSDKGDAIVPVKKRGRPPGQKKPVENVKSGSDGSPSPQPGDDQSAQITSPALQRKKIRQTKVLSKPAKGEENPISSKAKNGAEEQLVSTEDAIDEYDSSDSEPPVAEAKNATVVAKRGRGRPPKINKKATTKSK